MTLTHLLVFGAASLSIGWITSERWRGWLMLVLSLLALYWLQPPTPIRHLDFWLPTASLALTVIVWAATRAPVRDDVRPTLATMGVTALVVTGIALTRYLDPVCCLTSTRPPEVWEVMLALAVCGGSAWAVARYLPSRSRLVTVGALLVLGLFVVLKTDALARTASVGLRTLTGQPTDLASALDIRWLGISYIAFRLLHALRDRLSGKLPALSLQEFVTYALFFPALTAGPIDRADRFVKDTRAPFALSAAEVGAGGARIALGVFKKFVLADTLAIVALNAVNAGQAQSASWLWVMLYAYALRIYLDFSGYTDLALGLGQWLGVKLPENFDRPYLRPNLTMFWNSWHITLAQWFRAYFFNPLTRALRARPLPPALIILIGQAGTMLLIGLWHGVTWNFVAWGAWHAVGLFVHNRWADFAKAHATALHLGPMLNRASHILSVFLTFHFVTLGWVWFALPDVGLASRVMLRLLGV